MGWSAAEASGNSAMRPNTRRQLTSDPYGDFSVGRWLWVFQDVRHVEPVPAIGRQGVWTLPAAITVESA